MSELRKTLSSVQLAPISESCPNLKRVQESLSCSGDNFGPESIIKPCTSDFSGEGLKWNYSHELKQEKTVFVHFVHFVHVHLPKIGWPCTKMELDPPL